MWDDEWSRALTRDPRGLKGRDRTAVITDKARAIERAELLFPEDEPDG